MKYFFTILLLSNLFCPPLIGYTQNNSGSPVYFGDPFILLHDGTYYAYGTGAADGISVYVSQDLET